MMNKELARKVADILGKSFNNVYYNMPLAEQIEELVKVIENEVSK
jgi:hypothetical protein